MRVTGCRPEATGCLRGRGTRQGWKGVARRKPVEPAVQPSDLFMRKGSRVEWVILALFLAAGSLLTPHRPAPAADGTAAGWTGGAR